MIEILGTEESYFVKEEDIKSIQHYNNYVSYVYVQGIGRFEIEEQEYQKLKKLLEKDLEKNKEIERLNNLLKETSQTLSEQTTKAITLKSENERLNNIINELEHHLYQEWLEWKDSDCESIYSRAGEAQAIYDYLQELKGSDKE